MIVCLYENRTAPGRGGRQGQKSGLPVSGGRLPGSRPDVAGGMIWLPAGQIGSGSTGQHWKPCTRQSARERPD